MTKLVGFIAAVCVAGLTAEAAVITNDTWGTLNNNDGWVGVASPGHVGAPSAAFTNTAGYLSITGGNPGGFAEDFIYWGSLGGNHNYTNAGAIQFDFLADANGTNDLPSGLQLYFISGGTNWYYNIPTVQAGWGYGYYANMSFGSGWFSDNGPNDSSAFLSSLQDVDELGLILRYQDSLGGQIYGLDNFNLLDSPIPEPETYALLGFTILSLGFTFRRQLSKRMATIKVLRG